ncbi:MAG TPA: cation transporter, partial [Cyanophyceae cyanobacterium]
LTMHLGPREILLNLEIQFHRTISAEEVAFAVERLEKAICQKHPDIKNIFIEAKSLTVNRQRGSYNL